MGFNLKKEKSNATKILKEVSETLNKYDKAAKIVKSWMLEDVASMVFMDIEANFTYGGRYDGKNTDMLSGGSSKWTDLKAGTKGRYKALGFNPLNATLERTGNLRSAVDVSKTKNGIKVVVNRPHAAIHQFGGVIKHPGGTYYVIDENEYGEARTRFIKSSKAAKYKVVFKTGPHDIVMPARPYVVIQPDTIQEIGNKALEYWKIYIAERHGG